MGTEFRVRAAELRDYRSVCTLLDALDEFHRRELRWLFQKPAPGARSMQDYAESLEASDSALLVAVNGAHVIGVAAVMVRETPAFPVFVRARFAVIDNLVVDVSWRRRGVGAALVAASEGWARAHGATWLELAVYVFNDEARRFYAALGYDALSVRMQKHLTDTD